MNHLSHALTIALICGAAPVFAQHTETVRSVDRAAATILQGSDPVLLVAAAGTVPDSGWENGRLIPYRYITAPADGIWDFVFVADRKPGIHTQAITPIVALQAECEVPQWLKGVRIHSKTNSKEAGLTTYAQFDMRQFASASNPGAAEKQIPGVRGNLVLVEKDKSNASQVDKIKLHVGDEVEITWTYPVVPGSIPTGASSASSHRLMSIGEIRNVVRPGVVGAGTLAAFFEALNPGKATLTFTIKSEKPGGGDTGVILKCEVEVE